MTKSEFKGASLPANGRSYNPTNSVPVIHDGFAADLHALNQLTVSEDMRREKFGRVYRVYDGTGAKYFAGKIHAASFSGADEIHLALMQKMNAHQSRFTGRVYMGCAGLLNLGYIAAMKPGAAILREINPFQGIFWDAIIAKCAELPNPKHFAEYLQGCTTDIRYRILTAAGAVRIEDDYISPKYFKWGASPFRGKDINDPSLFEAHSPIGYWLHHESAYAHLHEMAKRGAIGTLTLDVMDGDGWEQLADHLHNQPDVYTDPEMNRRRKNLGIVYLSELSSSMKGQLWTCITAANANSPKVIANILRVCDPQGVAIIDDAASPSLQWPHLRSGYNPHHLRDVWGDARRAQAAHIFGQRPVYKPSI